MTAPASLSSLLSPESLAPLPPAAPLSDKLARSREVLAAVLAGLSPETAAVAYTGGKDSGVALWLWREMLAAAQTGPLRAISVDTGLKFPQVTAFRDKLCTDWGVELSLARPAIDLVTYPVAQDKLACCRDLKIIPLCQAIAETGALALITGIRRDEHPSRADRPYAEWHAETETCPGHWRAHPLLDWTEMDIWAFITGLGLPYCELYHEGYRSLGCMPCTHKASQDESERAGRDQDKERQLGALRSLGYF